MSHNFSAEERAALKNLLRRARESGALENLLAPSEPPSEDDFELPEEVTELEEFNMTDASKRRLVGQSENPSGYGQTRQLPLGPKAKPAAKPKAKAASSRSVLPTGSNVPLPDDVKDIHDWGSTIMETGKLAIHKMTYEQLATSTDVEIQKYLRYISKSITDRHQPQYHDLMAYLNAVDYGCVGPSGFNRRRQAD